MREIQEEFNLAIKVYFFDNFILLDQVLTGFSARAPDDAPYLVPLATTPSNHP